MLNRYALLSVFHIHLMKYIRFNLVDLHALIIVDAQLLPDFSIV